MDITEQQLRDDLVKQQGHDDLDQYRQRIVRVTRGKLSYSHLANIVRGIRPLNKVVLRFLGWERVTVTTFRKIAK